MWQQFGGKKTKNGKFRAFLQTSSTFIFYLGEWQFQKERDAGVFERCPLSVIPIATPVMNYGVNV